MSTYNVKESEYPAKSRSARRRQAGVTYTGTSTSPVVGGGSGTPAPVPEHDLLAGITSIDGAYPETARGIHLTAAAADQLKSLLANILTVLTTADTTTPAADNNVFSALRTLVEIANRAISKTEDDTAAGVISFMEGMRSNNHDPLSPLGPGMSLRALKDVNGNHTGYWELIVDYLKVNAKATFKEILVEQISHVGGSLLLSPASMECTEVVQILDTDGITVTRYRCYMDENKTNRWKVGDQALCQQFLLPTTRRYWRYVVAVGDHYIDLSATDCEPNSDIPQVDDNIIQFGSRTDSARRSAILITSYGDAGPSITMYKNIGVLLSGETSPYTLTNRAKTSIGGTLSRFVGQIIVEGEDGNEYAVSPYKGTWVSGTTAYFNDEFSYSGSTWVCKASPTTTVAPAEGAYWTKKVSKGDSGDKGDPGVTPTTYWLTTPPSISRSSAGAYTPATFSVYAYKSSGPIPELHAGQFVISETEDGSTYVVKYTSSANESGKTYTPSSATVKSFKVVLRKSITDTTVLDEQVIPVVQQAADGVSFWFLTGSGNIVKTGTTYAPNPVYFYPRMQVGSSAYGPATGCVFKKFGLNGAGMWAQLGTDVTITTELSFNQSVTSTYTAYKGQLYKGANLVDEQVFYVVENPTSVKDEIAKLFGFADLAALANKTGRIDVGLLDAILIVSQGLVVEDIANVVGAQFLPEIINIPQKNGLSFNGTANGVATSLNVSPNPIDSLATMLSTAAVSGSLQIPSASTGTPTWYTRQTNIISEGSPSVTGQYQTINAGINSIRYGSIPITAQLVVGARDEEDTSFGCTLTVKIYAKFWNGTTLLQENLLGQLHDYSIIQDQTTVSGTIPTNVLSTPSGATRVTLKAEFIGSVSFKNIYNEPPCKLVFAATPSSPTAIFSNATGALKSIIGIDGYAVVSGANDYFYLKAGSTKMQLSYMGDIQSNSISQKLLTMSVAASGLIVNVGGYMRKTGFVVGSSVTKVSTGVWRIQHDINSNYGLGPSSYTVHLTIQNGGYNIPGFMYISAYDTTSYNWTEVRAMNKDGVLIDTEFYVTFMRI